MVGVGAQRAALVRGVSSIMIRNCNAMTLKSRRHKKSKAWMHEHVNDPYVQKAKAEGYRSRAAFKLMEIDEKDRLLKPGMTVVDLGAAPGGWCQYAAKRIQPGGRLIALDLLEMTPMSGVEFHPGRFPRGRGAAPARSRAWATGRWTLFCRTWPPICRVSRCPIRRAACIWRNWRWNFAATT